MNRLYCMLCSVVMLTALNAQTTDGLVGYYSFNDSTANDMSGLGSNGIIVENDSSFVCGVEGLAFSLEGDSTHIQIGGVIGNYFEIDDFTFAFFMNPVSNQGTQTLFSKMTVCSDENAFSVRYTPASHTITVMLSESSSKRSILSTQLDFDKCWQHVAIVRDGSTTNLFVNGTLRDSDTAASRVDLDNSAILQIAAGPCVGVTDNRYGGLLDEIRIYDRALDDDETVGLYLPLIPDNIITSDTTVFLGNDVQIESGNSCADIFQWNPSSNLSDNTITEPLISPDQTLTYTINYIDNTLGCTATDSIRITVIDPNDLDCTTVFMPNAFTPNGDGRNDLYGISNPYAILDLISLEIFDRWGGRVFMTTNPMEKWDGNFKGQPMNPGVLLYKVRFRCDGEELLDVGSLSIIR